jgi:2-polyprenyl-6-methoxyphenol hydroxylase-like FAD-dependent oxidoreductase
MKHDLAVVIGGSIAGLMAARALSNHYARVILVEKDALADTDQPRKGVPQGHHVHVLLTSGLNMIEHFFPGFTDEMLQNGVDKRRWAEDMRWFQAGSWKTRVPCGFSFYPQSRVQLEQRIRARLRQQPGVEIRSDCGVQGLIQDSQQSDLAADLVVDAAGRGSRTLVWLGELGYASPPKESQQIDLAYFSRVYRKSAAARDWEALASHPLPNLPRGGIVVPVDADHWVVTLFGYSGDFPATTDEESFLALAKSLPVPDIYETLIGATPVSDVMKYSYPQQVRQRYDQVKRFPDGLLVIGDALCSLDPVFGQGMTVACKEARALDQILAAQPDDATPRQLRQQFFRACQKIIAVPWLITQAEALRFPATPGRRTPVIRALQWYTQHVFDLSSHSGEVYSAFLGVMHLMSGPQALFRPGVLGRVLGRAVRRPRATESR